MSVLAVTRQALIGSDTVAINQILDVYRNRETLQRMIRLDRRYIKFFSVDFEDLHGPFSQSYWGAVIGWFGSSMRISRKKFNAVAEPDTYERNACSLDDAAWDLMNESTRITEPYYLCNKYSS